MAFKIRQNPSGALPQTQRGELTTLPQTLSQLERGHPSPYPTARHASPRSPARSTPMGVGLYAYLAFSECIWMDYGFMEPPPTLLAHSRQSRLTVFFRIPVSQQITIDQIQCPECTEFNYGWGLLMSSRGADPEGTAGGEGWVGRRRFEVRRRKRQGRW